jgi:hypothetical protein
MSSGLDRRLRALETAQSVDRVKFTVSDRFPGDACADGDDTGELSSLMTLDEWEAAFSFSSPYCGPPPPREEQVQEGPCVSLNCL